MHSSIIAITKCHITAIQFCFASMKVYCLIYNILWSFFMHLFPPYNDIKETHKFQQMYINTFLYSYPNKWVFYIDKNHTLKHFGTILLYVTSRLVLYAFCIVKGNSLYSIIIFIAISDIVLMIYIIQHLSTNTWKWLPQNIFAM